MSLPSIHVGCNARHNFRNISLFFFLASISWDSTPEHMEHSRQGPAVFVPCLGDHSVVPKLALVVRKCTCQMNPQSVKLILGFVASCPEAVSLNL
jgi:hypothetical protein